MNKLTISSKNTNWSKYILMGNKFTKHIYYNKGLKIKDLIKLID